MRFANRVPLTFDQGSCAITEALKSIDWKRYGIKDFENSPITLFVNMISTQIPYLSTGKQSIAPEPEILHEVRQATMTLARKLQKHIKRKKADKEKAMRSKIFEEIVPVIIEESAALGEVEVPDYTKVLSKVTKRAIAELLGEVPEEEEEEEEDEALIMEELDEYGYAVDEEQSNLKKEKSSQRFAVSEDDLIYEERMREQEEAKEAAKQAKKAKKAKEEGE